MKFYVQIQGKAQQVFDTADEALRYAMHHVYLSSDRIEDQKTILNSGNMAMFSYGFSEVFIIPKD